MYDSFQYFKKGVFSVYPFIYSLNNIPGYQRVLKNQKISVGKPGVFLTKSLKYLFLNRNHLGACFNKRVAKTLDLPFYLVLTNLFLNESKLLVFKQENLADNNTRRGSYSLKHISNF